MRTYRIVLLTATLLCSSFYPSFGQTLYKVSLFRAAPGKLLPLIDNLTSRTKNYEQKGGSRPYIIRHSQGDQWDLMVYEHISDYDSYFSRQNNFNKVFSPAFGDTFYDLVAFHENIFTSGPSYKIVQELIEQNSFFHIEMFVALPGKQAELLKQRNMENIYLREIGRGENLIFTTTLGGSWDCFTLGGYKDIKHYAESADISLEVEEKAAVNAGFEGVKYISPYLRSLITTHHDTLGGKVQ